MSNIIVVDAPMGKGKTSWGINYMNELGSKPFRNKVIYITPYLDEITRVKESVYALDLIEPELKYRDGKSTKLSHLKELLYEGADIISTHALFKNVDEDVIDLLQSRGYELILDEVFQVIDNIFIKKNDLKLILDSRWIIPVEGDTRGLYKWNYEVAPSTDTTFDYIKEYADTKNLYIFNNSALYWTFPVSVFKLFKKIYILTYLFDAQVQAYYYKMYDMDYKLMTIDNSNGNYKLIDWDKDYDKEFRDKVRELMNVYEGDLNTNYLPDKLHKEREKTFLSSTWYKKKDEKSKSQRVKLKNNMDNYFRNICKAKTNDRLWTTYKSSQDDIKGKRYGKQFLSYTTRATNQYKNVTNMALMLNLYMNPNEVNYFTHQGVDVNQDLLAVSDAMQWIFRSAIRDDNSINIYIPSSRMRDLLSSWIDGKL
ncbi:MAG: hypothetical protein ACRC7S_18570 [Cetobacterium sp.]